MRKITWLVLLFAIAIGIVFFCVNRRKPLVIKFADRNITVSHEWLAGTVSSRADSAEIVKVFDRYMRISSRDDYLGLFLPNEAPNISPDEFIQWRAFLQKATLVLLDSFEFESGGQRFGAVHYSTDLDSQSVDETFLVKHIDGQWWPVSRQQNRDFKLTREWLLRIRPIALRMLHGSLNDSDRGILKTIPTHALIEERLRSAVISDDNAVDAAAVLITLDRLLSSVVSDEQAFARAIAHFAEKSTAPVPNTSKVAIAEAVADELVVGAFETNKIDRVSHDALISIMTEKKYSEDQQRDVLQRIKRGEMLGAAKQMMQYEGGASVYDYVVRIRAIYGDEVIRIWSSRDGQFH